MPFGDSTTKGIGEDGNEALTSFSYRDHLQLLLGVGVCDFVGQFQSPISGTILDTDHNGRSGWTPSDLTNPTQNDGMHGVEYTDLRAVMTKPNPPGSMVVLMVGTAAAAWVEAGAPKVVATEVAATMAIITDIHTWDPTVAIHVALIPPARAQYTAINAWIDQFNAALRTAVTARMVTKANLDLTDMHAAFLANPNWDTQYFNAAEGVHPNDVGYQVIAQAWYEAILHAKHRRGARP